MLTSSTEKSVEPVLLRTSDEFKLRHLLSEDPNSHLYLSGIISDSGVMPLAGHPDFKFYGQPSENGLAAALFIGGRGGLVIPCATLPTQAIALADAVLRRYPSPLQSCLGEKTAVEGLLNAFRVRSPRVTRLQTLFTVSADDLGPFTNPTLRLATEMDVPQIMTLAKAREAERLDLHPETPVDFLLARIIHRVRGRRTYVLEINNILVFKVDVGSRSPLGAELEGIYTLPGERRQGHAILSLGQISRHLLGSMPRLAMRIDDDDKIMPVLARKVGYVAGKKQMLVIA